MTFIPFLKLVLFSMLLTLPQLCDKHNIVCPPLFDDALVFSMFCNIILH